MLDLKKLRRLPKGADLSHIHPDLRGNLNFAGWVARKNV